MKTSVSEALVLTFVMAAVIFFCRAFPFLFFRGKTRGVPTDAPPETREAVSPGGGIFPAGREGTFIAFVGKIVPPAAMTVLAFNALALSGKANIHEIIPALAAAVFTAAVHLWRRNPLISIFGGTALFMVLQRVI